MHHAILFNYVESAISQNIYNITKFSHREPTETISVHMDQISPEQNMPYSFSKCQTG